MPESNPRRMQKAGLNLAIDPTAIAFACEQRGVRTPLEIRQSDLEDRCGYGWPAVNERAGRGRGGPEPGRARFRN